MNSKKRLSSKKALVVLGTRPEAIKLAPVITELKRHANRFNSIVCATGQHREMLWQMLESFSLSVDHNLDVMKPDQSLAEVTTAVLNGLDRVLASEKPDVVLVQGDTTTTFAASLAAYYRRIPVGHVEAGLRTGDRHNPFPEEANRRLTTHLADFHFAPTELSRANLLREGVTDERIVVTGNTVVDALNHIVSRLVVNPKQVASEIPDTQRLILVTAHRRESFGPRLRQICKALRALAESRPDVLIIYPVHLNPNVQMPVRAILEGIPNITLLEPLDYVSFVALMKRAHILLTDSGGMQEEGPSLRKPVLVMRSVSERPEAVMAGSACLVGTDPAKIITAVNRLLDEPKHYEQMTARANPFGDGRAAARIVAFLTRALFPGVSETQSETGRPIVPDLIADRRSTRSESPSRGLEG
jgi:UDP-N-acetylglucosamine 2-epimerase (non-hydrolysing)